MLLTFLYHGINKGRYATVKEMIEKHLTYLSSRYNIVVPGDKLSFFKLNICLTFDDAYFDFYAHIFPLLKKFNIKAVLAVPIKFIQEKTDLKDSVRLSIPSYYAMKEKKNLKKVPFCTWEELKEMSDSEHVVIASHSFTHVNLMQENLNLHREIVESKNFIEKKLGKNISTFVYPLGKFNEKVHKMVKKHYRYAMRIGSAWNFSWQNFSGIIYRVISDGISRVDEHIRFPCFFSYLWFYLLNSVRKR